MCCHNLGGLIEPLKPPLATDLVHVDTKVGPVNIVTGTVCAISASCITIQFDHINELYDVEMVKSRYMVMTKYCMHKKQFPSL